MWLILEIWRLWLPVRPVIHMASLTLLPLDKMAAILADISPCIFLTESGRILIYISLKFVPMSSIDNRAALVQVMAWRWTGDKPLPEPMMTHFTDTYMRHSLGPSDVIWRQKTGSTLAQVMACCLTAPSHYLNQCWLIISKVHSSQSNFARDTPANNHWK